MARESSRGKSAREAGEPAGVARIGGDEPWLELASGVEMVNILLIDDVARTNKPCPFYPVGGWRRG